MTQLEEVDKAIVDFLPRFECTLNTIPGVSDTTVAKLLSEIGDIRQFSNAEKLANFAGKGNAQLLKQGNRRLQGTIYFLAIQMIQLSSKGLSQNPAFYAYYQRRLARPSMPCQRYRTTGTKGIFLKLRQIKYFKILGSEKHCFGEY